MALETCYRVKTRALAAAQHDAFGYFAAHYGIRFLAPQGMSTDAQASAKGVAQLIRQSQREKISAVFVENMGNPKLLAQIGHNVTQLAAGMTQNLN